MTPGQCKAARALIGMTQSQLANTAGTGLSTVVDFERARRQVSRESIDALQVALNKLGIEFIDENGGGAGVRLRNPSRSGKRK
jgi:transcriptional regulator with XRE-family HTH domain